MTNNISSPDSTNQIKTAIDYPIKTHFQESWSRFIKGLLPAFLVTLVIGVVVVILIAITGFLGVGLVSSNNAVITAVKDFSVSGPAALLDIPGSFWLSIGGLFLVYVIVVSLLGLVSQTALVLVLANKTDERPGVMTVLKQALPFVPAVFVLGFVSSLLVLGGTWLLVIPGIFISLMVGFSMFEIVLDKKGPIASLKSSTALISEHFGFFITHLLAFIGVYLVIYIFIPLILKEISSTLESVYSLVSSLLSMGWSWFSIAYMLDLYLKIKQSSTHQKTGNIAWMVVVSIIGWLIFGLSIKVLINFANSGALNDLTNVSPELTAPSQIEQKLTPEELDQMQTYFNDMGMDPTQLDQATLDQLQQMGVDVNQLNGQR